MSKVSIEDQIKAIGRIMGKPEVPHYLFNFGKYSGKTFDYVLKNDINYLIWLYNNDVALPDEIINYIEQDVIK